MVMADAVFAFGNPECRLYSNVLAAKREFHLAAVARAKLVGLPDDAASNTLRHQAFEDEQRSLKQYIDALRRYKDFIENGNVPKAPP